MSIVALKRNSQRYTKNVSGKHSGGFSLNGTFRNQGWVGQCSTGRTLVHTPYKGAFAMGHGGNIGRYVTNNIKSIGTCPTNNSSVVKRSTMNTSAHIAVSINFPTSVFINNCIKNCKIIWVKNFTDMNRCQSSYIDTIVRGTNHVIFKPTACKFTSNCHNGNTNDYSNKQKHHIGGKVKTNNIYTKVLLYGIGQGEYLKTSLMTKNNLPTPACKASFPHALNHTGKCDVNYMTPQEAIAGGALPADWMNCVLCKSSARPYTTTIGASRENLTCNSSINNLHQNQLNGQFS